MTHLRPNQWPADGSVPDYVSEYIDWRLDPSNHPHNISQYARDHSIHRITIHQWHKDKRFQTALEARASELNVRPDRIQDVINAIWNAAKAGDMKAAALYLQYADKLNPKRVVIEDRRISEMSDEELRAELAALDLS